MGRVCWGDGNLGRWAIQELVYTWNICLGDGDPFCPGVFISFIDCEYLFTTFYATGSIIIEETVLVVSEENGDGIVEEGFTIDF